MSQDVDKLVESDFFGVMRALPEYQQELLFSYLGELEESKFSCENHELVESQCGGLVADAVESRGHAGFSNLNSAIIDINLLQHWFKAHPFVLLIASLLFFRLFRFHLLHYFFLPIATSIFYFILRRLVQINIEYLGGLSSMN